MIFPKFCHQTYWYHRYLNEVAALSLLFLRATGHINKDGSSPPTFSSSLSNISYPRKGEVTTAAESPLAIQISWRSHKETTSNAENETDQLHPQSTFSMFMFHQDSKYIVDKRIAPALQLVERLIARKIFCNKGQPNPLNQKMVK